MIALLLSISYFSGFLISLSAFRNPHSAILLLYQFLLFFKPASPSRAILGKGDQYAFGRQIETSGGNGIHFALASRDPNSGSAHYFPAAGLHIISEAGKARGG
jgi:hypothetical protein